MWIINYMQFLLQSFITLQTCQYKNDGMQTLSYREQLIILQHQKKIEKLRVLREKKTLREARVQSLSSSVIKTSYKAWTLSLLHLKLSSYFNIFFSMIWSDVSSMCTQTYTHTHTLTTRMRVPRHSAKACRSNRLRIWKNRDSLSKYILCLPMFSC